ncbi:MAG TPA: anti-sigma-D factor RsdA [Mycobacterium sp.]|uniref:anti-sigma-D factor RsdA n=1 Tax=Mycobacterium sp. TaxID=1785 RepID=UPI002D262DE7|nr:anti-sigma-D factor RsdA [Mycobacterium sp.]HZU48006.1 anti-sigma-D factor RsdA [Mycobacterium sp.]
MPDLGPEFGFGRSPADQPSLEAIARSDRFLDALATRESVDVADPDDELLAALLEEWRDDLRWPPASALVSDEEAAVALQIGLAARQRTRRALAMVGSVAAAVLALGGFGAMVGTAHPGDALYGVHTMLFGEPPSLHDEQVELSAKTELAQVQQMIAQGQWDQAQNKLAAVSSTVQSVNDSNRKQGLIDQVNQLNAKVATHDPNATLTPSSPPTTGAVSPSASVSVSGASSSTALSPPEATSGTSTSPSATDATTTVTTSGPAATSTPSTSSVASSSPSTPSSPPSTPSSPQQHTAAGTTSTNSAPAQSPSQVVSVTPTTPSAAPSASSSVPKAGETAAQTTVATSPVLSSHPQSVPNAGG